MTEARPLDSRPKPGEQPRTDPVVFVVDDDVSVRESLEPLLRSAGWEVRMFASASEFLAHPKLPAPSCVILDVGLPDTNGLDLQQRFASELGRMPIIFITGHGDVAMTVRAMKAGALEFLTKPLCADVVVDAVEHALEVSDTRVRREAEMAVLSSRHASLTRREAEVMKLVTAGRLNKQVAADLGISEITVKAHRGKVMGKMSARTLPDLVRMAEKLSITT